VPAVTAPDPEEARIRDVLAAIPIARLRSVGLLDTLLTLGTTQEPADRSADRSQIETMDADALVRMAMAEAEG
jgi:hypothetical protein